MRQTKAQKLYQRSRSIGVDADIERVVRVLADMPAPTRAGPLMTRAKLTEARWRLIRDRVKADKRVIFKSGPVGTPHLYSLVGGVEMKVAPVGACTLHEVGRTWGFATSIKMH